MFIISNPQLCVGTGCRFIRNNVDIESISDYYGFQGNHSVFPTFLQKSHCQMQLITKFCFSVHQIVDNTEILAELKIWVIGNLSYARSLVFSSLNFPCQLKCNCSVQHDERIIKLSCINALKKDPENEHVIDGQKRNQYLSKKVKVRLLFNEKCIGLPKLVTLIFTD